MMLTKGIKYKRDLKPRERLTASALSEQRNRGIRQVTLLLEIQSGSKWIKEWTVSEPVANRKIRRWQ